MRGSVGIDRMVHWACAVDEALDRAVGNSPAQLASYIIDRRAFGGEPVIGLDAVGSFASFLEASLLAEGFRLVHAPGIAVNRAGQGFAGGERTCDPRDARSIADLVRTRDLRPILPDDAAVAAIRLKVGRRRDLTEEQTRRMARLSALLGSVHPGLEGELDVTCKGPLTLLTRYVTPAEIRQAGRRRIIAYLVKTPHLRAVERLAEQAFAAAHARSLAVTGEAAIAELVRELAVKALGVKVKMARIDHDITALLAAHPQSALIQSLPGMGAVLVAEFTPCAGCIRRLSSTNALAAAAGLAPVIWRSTLGGDKALKRVFFQSAFCAVCTRDPLSKAFEDRKRREGNHHTQAFIAFARRRVTVLWTMIQRRQTFDPLINAA